MFLYEKVGHSKLVEMHGGASDFYRSKSKTSAKRCNVDVLEIDFFMSLM
jgi:hypothetical protein